MQVFKLTIGDKEKTVKVPSNWSEVTLSTFQNIVSINPDTKAEDRKAIELALLIGVGVSEIKNYPFQIISQIIDYTNRFLKIETEFPDIREFEHEGQRYIVPEWDYREMTFGEWMDAQTIIAIKTEVEGDNYENAQKLIAVLCRKEGKPDYDSDEVESVSESFKTLPMSIVFSITSFFLQQKESCMKSLVIFSALLSKEVQRVKSIYHDSDSTEHLQTLLNMVDSLSPDLPPINQLNEPTLESV